MAGRGGSRQSGVLAGLGNLVPENETGPCHTKHKINPERVENLSLRPGAIRLLGENLAGSCRTSVSAMVFWIDPESRNKAGPHRTKRLLHSKGNRPQAKRRQAEREKVLVSDKALMSKTDREFMQLNKEKKPN